MQRPILVFISLAFFLGGLTSCKFYKHMLTSGGGCDTTIWDHVYRPNRLKILESCITVRGTIIGKDYTTDGDASYFLKLDAGQDSLLYKANYRQLNGNLMIEIVCAGPVSRKDPKKGCKGYVNNVAEPTVGAHVSVTGTYVIDRHNQWSEIHPVTRIDRL
ncbi:MAG: hypothetical protein JWP27_1967 [Flaviaesturariibacter sp.]|nr:hypothetical protein [Flaviaesturariibacter sp.]